MFVGKPVFYTNDITWSKALGYDLLGRSIFDSKDARNILNGDPTNFTEIVYASSANTQNDYWLTFNRVNVPTSGAPDYVAVLGHNLASCNVGIRHHFEMIDGTTWNGGNGISEDIVNGNGSTIAWNSGTHSTFLKPEYDGFSIYGINGQSADGYHGVEGFQFYVPDDEWLGASQHTLKIGTIFCGKRFSFDEAPDVKLTQSVEYDGTRSQKTASGYSHYGIDYMGSPKWGDYGPWEIDNGTGMPTLNTGRGRRVWDLKWSQISDSQIFPASTLGGDVITDPDDYGYLGGISPSENNLWNATAGVFTGAGGTYGWQAYSGNTIENDSNTLKVTFGTGENASGGSYQYLRSSGDLDSALSEVDSVFYLFKGRIKSNDSSKYYNFRVYHGDSGEGGNNSFTTPQNNTGWGSASDASVEFHVNHNSEDGSSGGAWVRVQAVDSEGNTRIPEDGEYCWIDNIEIYQMLGSGWIETNSSGLATDGDWAPDGNILSANTFYSAVYNKCMGSRFPFIFQPDSNNTSPSGFSLCKFVNNSLQVKREGFKRYGFSLKIEEVW